VPARIGLRVRLILAPCRLLEDEQERCSASIHDRLMGGPPAGILVVRVPELLGGAPRGQRHARCRRHLLHALARGSGLRRRLAVCLVHDLIAPRRCLQRWPGRLSSRT